MAKKVLQFYDIRTKKKFKTDKYKYVTKKGTKFAVAKYKGKECWRIIGKV